MSHKATINLVTYDPKRDAHVLVAVEQGPWPSSDNSDSLRRLQEKLYDYVDIAVDGILASKYPESKGKSVVIRLDCYDTPREDCEKFFFRFAEYIHTSKEIQTAITEQGHIKDIDFEFNWREIAK
jgi:hypothetical protein